MSGCCSVRGCGHPAELTALLSPDYCSFIETLVVVDTGSALLNPTYGQVCGCWERHSEWQNPSQTKLRNRKLQISHLPTEGKGENAGVQHSLRMGKNHLSSDDYLLPRDLRLTFLFLRISVSGIVFILIQCPKNTRREQKK